MQRVVDFQDRTPAAIAKTMVALQYHFTFQIVLLQVVLDRFQGFIVTSAEAGTAHANLYDHLFSHL